jgi:hypothetical protein
MTAPRSDSSPWIDLMLWLALLLAAWVTLEISNW